MAIKILWISRHIPLEVQIHELISIFGPDTEVIQDDRKIQSADDIVERMRRGNFQEIVFVGPQSVLQELCRRGMRPLYSKMKSATSSMDSDLNYQGRFLRFMGFIRVNNIIWETEPLSPRLRNKAS